MKAQKEPTYRFYLLYDKIYREDILPHTYALAKANYGAPGDMRTMRCRLMLLILLGFPAITLGRVPQKAANTDVCVTDPSQGLGCAHGIVADQDGKPVKSIEVDLIPTFKQATSNGARLITSGLTKWAGTTSTELKQVNILSPSTARRPLTSIIHSQRPIPGVTSETEAERVSRQSTDVARDPSLDKSSFRQLQFGPQSHLTKIPFSGVTAEVSKSGFCAG